MPFTPRPLRYISAIAAFLFLGYSYSHAQVVCETGYYAEYSAGGHLLPAAITSLHNGQQVITGNYAQYLWSTGANTQKLLVSAPGTYWVTVTDNYGCKGKAIQ
jgi:hypothetical protein